MPMLQLSASLVNRPVMSLRTGSQIALASELIINPNNLKVEGFYCQDLFSKSRLILLSQDIRDIIKNGIVVNDHDVLSEPVELVRLKELLNINFQLMGKSVVTANKKRLGKVNDFAAESATMYIQKLYVAQPLLKSLSGGQLSVDRNQIIEITSRKVVIQDPLQPIKAKSVTPVTAPSFPGSI